MASRTVVVLQPSYIPWRGYFDLIRRADLFVFYDDVQYDKGGWRNRNKIKTSSGTQWLTIPVHAAGNVAEHTAISSIKIDERVDWRRKHLASIRHAYSKAPFFEVTFERLQSLFADRTPLLAEFTIASTIGIARDLGFNTEFIRSSSLPAHGERLDRLMSVLAAVGATRYISGPSARAYIDPTAFESAGIALEYIAYNYAEYNQLHGAFEAAVSIVDLLMMQGPRAADYILEQAAAAPTPNQL